MNERAKEIIEEIKKQVYKTSQANQLSTCWVIKDSVEANLKVILAQINRLEKEIQ